MAINTAEKRRAVAGIAAHPMGPAVTPTVGKDQEWRQQVAWGYSGILAGAPVVVEVRFESGLSLGLYKMIVTASDSFTRPANTTAYADNDLVANDVDAGDVVPLEFRTSALGSGRGIIRRVRLFKDDETPAEFTIHLFTQAPVVSGGDNAAFAVSTARNYLGPVVVDFSTGLVTSTDAIGFVAVSPEINFDLVHISASERRLYGLIQMTDAGGYAPASGELFEVTLELAGVN